MNRNLEEFEHELLKNSGISDFNVGDWLEDNTELVNIYQENSITFFCTEILSKLIEQKKGITFNKSFFVNRVVEFYTREEINNNRLGTPLKQFSIKTVLLECFKKFISTEEMKEFKIQNGYYKETEYNADLLSGKIITIL